jgi:hypothetical protein
LPLEEARHDPTILVLARFAASTPRE